LTSSTRRPCDRLPIRALLRRGSDPPGPAGIGPDAAALRPREPARCAGAGRVEGRLSGWGETGPDPQGGAGHLPDGKRAAAGTSRWKATHACLLDILWRFSDRIEPDPDPAGAVRAAYYLDFGTLRQSDTEQLAKQVQAEVRRELGLVGRVGLASSKFTAQVVAATGKAGVQAVLYRTEAEYLNPLPVRRLPLEAEQAHRLMLLGIHSLGQLAALPRSAMLAQLGPNGPLLHDLAHGIDPRPLVPQALPRQRVLSHEFEPPLEDRMILSATLDHLAGQLGESLTASHEAARSVRLSLSLADGRVLADLRRPRQPIPAAGDLRKLLAVLLKKFPAEERVSAIEVCLGDLEPVLARQLSLFGEEAVQDKAAQAIQALLARHAGLAVYQVQAAENIVLLPERCFRLEKVGAA
jgi:DNA polymerase-4